MPISVINSVTLEAQLLEKIKITQQTIEAQIMHVTSALDVLHYYNIQRMLANFAEILLSQKTIDEKKEELKPLLAERWQSIKGSSEGYCERPRYVLNQLCLAIALYICPLPEDLSDCDNWEVNQGPYFLLMPGLEACRDIVTGKNIHQYCFQEFILSEDNKRYIPIVETLDYFFKSPSSKPFHLVFSDEEIADESFKEQKYLTDSEFSQLSQHSVLTFKIIQNARILKEPSNFFSKINDLADGLFAGSAHGGSGTGDNAAAKANEAIIAFFLYWDSLTPESKNFYYHKIFKLKDHLEALRNPVSIAKQGSNYCVGLIAGDLRHEANINRTSLESYRESELRKAIENLFTKLETDINQPNYSINLINKNVKPSIYQIINIETNEQSRLISQYLDLDYPNFLLYAFEKQPAMVPGFINALKNNKYKQHIMQQRSKDGMSVLMIAALSYSEVLERLLLHYLELDITQIKSELMTRIPTGDTLAFIIIQQCPTLLPQILAVISKFTQDEQLGLLMLENGHDENIITIILENHANAFLQLCDLLKAFPVENIERVLGHTTAKNNTLLMNILLNYPYAVTPIMNLFNRCKVTTQKNWLIHLNSTGLNLLYIALNADFNAFKNILDITAKISQSQLRTILNSVREPSFFLRASCSDARIFNASLVLLDNFSLDEQWFFLKAFDAQNNHLLLRAMYHQSTPPTLLFQKFKLLSRSQLYTLLNTKNEEGFFPLTLALTQCPQYFVAIAELISGLSADQQHSLWQVVDVNGYSLPLLAILYAPEHTAYLLNHVNESTLSKAIKETDFNGNSFVALITSFQPKYLPFFINALKTSSKGQRLSLIGSKNQQGDNLLTYILQHDANLLESLFELMEDFTITQKRELIEHRNNQGEYALTIAFVQGIDSFDALLKLANNSHGNNKNILSDLSLPCWFDLLRLACVNTKVFQDLYATYQSEKDQALGPLLSYCDLNGNNLMMLILQSNSTLATSIIRDIKNVLEERIQQQIMIQKNTRGEHVLSLAEKYAPDHFVASLLPFLKRLDKQSTQQMMLTSTLKMHSGEIWVSPEKLEDCISDTLFEKLSEQDSQGNNLLSQIILHMPDRLPSMIEKMQDLLSSSQIKTLLTHQNHEKQNCYWLALRQNQSAYLCNQIQSLVNNFDEESRLSIFTAPAKQPLMEAALKQSKATFMIIMQGLKASKAAYCQEIIEQFWQQPSEQLEAAFVQIDFDVTQRLINTTTNMSVDKTTALMIRNKNALMLALTSREKSIKDLICRWMLSLPRSNRFKILSECSADTILSLLNSEKTSIVDVLSLEQQTQLLTLRDQKDDSVLVKAFANKNNSCQGKLINRLPLFTPQQLAMLFQTTQGNTSFLQLIVKISSPLSKKLLTNLSRLPSDTQFALLNHIDNHGWMILDHLQNIPNLYEYVLNIYDNLNLKNQVKLYLQQTSQQACILINSPLLFKQRIVEQFMTFPQHAKIEILLAIDSKDKNSLRRLLEALPNLQNSLLDMIQSFPVHIQSVLISPKEELKDSLISWMATHPNYDVKRRAVILMTSLVPGDLKVLLMFKNQQGDNFLQDIAKSQPALFSKVFALFMSLDNDSKAELLLGKNHEDRTLFSDLITYQYYDHFENLCKTISKLPDNQKISILSASGIVPIKLTSSWVRLLYNAPQCKAFSDLLNNKLLFNALHRLLLSLPPETQLTILSNRNGSGKALIEDVREPEKTKLRLVINNAKILIEMKKLLDAVGEKIANKVFSPGYNLYHKLLSRLEIYHTNPQKMPRDVVNLSNNITKDIKEALPEIHNDLTSANIWTACLKLAGSVIIPPYGGYKLCEKAITHRNVFFQSSLEKTLYKLQTLGDKIKNTAVI